MGRSAIQLGPELWQITPSSMGDTWKAENLASKIDHIVVVMMENRSFDHVLGYLAHAGDASDGLTAKLVSYLGDKGFDVSPLARAESCPTQWASRRNSPRVLVTASRPSRSN